MPLPLALALLVAAVPAPSETGAPATEIPARAKAAKLRPKEVWRTHLHFAGTSSPRPFDANGDGVLDVVLGSGRENEDGAISLVDGKTGRTRWTHRVRAEVYGTAALLDVTGDGTPDVGAGGRFPDLYALDGKTGKPLWKLSKANPGAKIGQAYFNSPLVLPDEDGDGVGEVLAVQGGDADDSRRAPGRYHVVSGKTGTIRRTLVAPDGREAYAVPVVLRGAGGALDAIVATGGETLPGHLFRIDLATGEARWRVATKKKGFVGSPLVHVYGDGSVDVLAASFEGTVLRVDAATGAVRWQVEFPGHEIYSIPAPGFFDGDDVPDVAIVRNRGRFPVWDRAQVTFLSGTDGALLGEVDLGVSSMASISVLDANGAGTDDVLVTANLDFGSNYEKISSVLACFDGKTRARLFSRKLPGMSAATPWVGDLDGDGTLDVVHASWKRVVRFAIPGVPPAAVRLGGYRGTELDGVAPTWARETKR